MPHLPENLPSRIKYHPMSNRAVLMSIKPKYADLIFAGTKTIELRRSCPKIGRGDLVLIYVSIPRMALVGGFEVAGIVSAEPLTLCKKWQAQSGVEKETFLHYFQGKRSTDRRWALTLKLQSPGSQLRHTLSPWSNQPAEHPRCLSDEMSCQQDISRKTGPKNRPRPSGVHLSGGVIINQAFVVL
jgi:predicted transcriptional regulator